MNSNGFPDYLATWAGNGSTRDIIAGYTPRSCTVIGVSANSNIQLSKISPMPTTDALSLPSGTIVPAIEFIPGGIRVSGAANQSNWTYYATILQ